jgi:5-methylcytosine-specific restriction endonuclease McrA
LERDRNRNKNHARRLAVGVAQDFITLNALGERDGWRCGLCGKRVRKARRYQQDPLGASVDHLVPLSLGGSHTWANVQLAHYGCNARKNNRPAGEQLRLVG